MKTLRVALSILSIFTLMLIPDTTLQSQRGKGPRGSGGWGQGGHYGRMYDQATVETLSGVVIKVERMTPRRGMSYGIHLLLKTDKGLISVHLGPSWFINRQDMKIKKNDTIRVTGSRITINKKPAIIAAEITKGKHVLKLRDQSGFPVWAGWRRR